MTHHIDLWRAYHHKEIGGRELTTIRADRILYLLHIVDSVAQRYSLNNIVARTRCYHIDTILQLTHFVLTHASRRVRYLDRVLVVDTIDRPTRHTYICRVYAQAQILFQSTLHLAYNFAKQNIVLDIAIADALTNILRLDSNHRNLTTTIATTNSHSDFRRANIYSYYILLLHIYFVHIICLSNLASIIL